MRELIGADGGAGLLYTGMLSAKAVPTENPKKSDAFSWNEEELPILVGQIFGNEPEDMGVAAKRIEKEGCFVATAVYSSYEHPSVLILRKFRDRYLLKRRWGVAFVNLYYKHSPKLAKQVKKSNILKGIFYIPIQTLDILLNPQYKDK